MKSAAVPLSLLLCSMLTATTLIAAKIDMNDVHRAVGRENDVRVDAQLLSDTVRAGTPISVTYQIHNLTDKAVAVAEKVCAATYDADTEMITVAVGSEIPLNGELPPMATIGPGEKKTFSTAATLHGSGAALRAAKGSLRSLQIKVSVLRNLAPFLDLLERQQSARTTTGIPLTDDQFVQWLESNDTIFLNELPVRFERGPGSNFDASHRGARAGSQ